MPALHISLRSFLKFFNMLETRCYHIDFKVAALSGSANGLNKDQIDSMVKAFNEIRELQKDIENVEHTITLVHQAITENIAKDFENEEEIKKIYEPRRIFLAKQIETKVK